jgi:hypothetical protein
MMNVSRREWIEVAKRVVAGDTVGLRCPVSDDDQLQVQWIPIDAGRGEYRLSCRGCGAENYVLADRADKNREHS